MAPEEVARDVLHHNDQLTEADSELARELTIGAARNVVRHTAYCQRGEETV